MNMSYSKILTNELLKHNEVTLRSIINAITESVFLMDTEGTVIVINETAAHRLGKSVDEIMGKNIYDFIPPKVAESRRVKADEVIRTGEPTQFEDIRLGRYILNSIYPVIDNNGKVDRLAIFGYDITELKQTEKKLKQTVEELERSNSELEKFSYIASHDLQEPLRKIQAFGSLLSSRYTDVLDERGQDYLERMQNASKRMKKLINDLLKFSRITTRGQPFVSVDLNEVVEEVMYDLEMQIKKTDGHIEIGQLPTIEVDQTQIRQVFHNLISNALKFHKEDVVPVVKLYSKKIDYEQCQLFVEDNGIGFDEKYIDRIFSIFQRLHSRSEYSGTGVGLALCKKIIERHGGTITARSPGEGAKFIVTLPVKQV